MKLKLGVTEKENGIKAVVSLLIKLIYQGRVITKQR